MGEFRIGTERLALRAWRDDDVAPFLVMCRDPAVMEFLGPPLEEAEAAAAVARQQAFQRDFGHCFWAVERREDSRFLGFCGLKPGPAGTPLHDRVEIGWRLAQHAWGKGYAREAATASLQWGFAELGADMILAMTVRGNSRSWGLMERLGMTYRPELDFDHPANSEGDPLRPHIVYALERAVWAG